MKSVLMIGMGRFGRHMSEKLLELGHEVMAVDMDENRIIQSRQFVTNSEIGDASHEDFIKHLGVENYDLCVVSIGDNFQNSLIITSLLREQGAKFIVSRASRDIQAKLLLRNGANEVIYPEKEQAITAAVKFGSDNVFGYIPLTEDIAIYETPVPAAWIGKTLAELNIRKKFGINVVAIKLGDRIISTPGAEYVFTGTEVIFIIGTEDKVQEFTKF